ncbi:MAG: hypothetical protein HYX72_10785 [Acidobacteria bacterium]|nr:hypothetical protein [Acidobacteriota bacterium]
MRHVILYLASLLVLVAAGPGARAQISEPPQLTAAQRATEAPTESDIYCAGFFSRTPVASDLIVLSGQDPGLRFEYGDRDIIFLNKGAESIKAPGGHYMVLRAVKDLNPTEPYPGQRKLVAQMGTMYAEIARIQINIVHKGSSTAEILHACEPVLAGDIAVPLSAHVVPRYREARITDRFAPSSGKAQGVIAAIKGFREAAGGGEVVYVNVGAKENLKPGDYLRIFRSQQSPSQYNVRAGVGNYPTDVMGVQMGRRLTRQELDSLPRTVLGEVMILSVQETSSTGIVTYSWEDLFPGDQLEIE